jgi:ribosomal protein L44E
MPEHFTRNTVSASFFCNKCGKFTQHRIDDGRKGPCLDCIARLDAAHAMKQAEPEAVQGDLFPAPARKSKL